MFANFVAFSVRLATGVAVKFEHPRIGRNPVVYFANHGSNLDALVIWASLPRDERRKVRPVAARDYWDAGVVRRFLARHVFNAIFIDRKNLRPKQDPLAETTNALCRGASIIIFPEGKRSPTDRMGSFRSGIFHLARRVPEIEFIPVYLHNLNRVLPKGEFFPVPVICSISFGTPQHLNEGETKSSFTARMKACLHDLREESHA